MPIFSITRRDARFAGDGYGDQFVEPERPEGMADHGAGAFGGEAEVPIPGGQPPADLDGRHEVRLETRHREPDETDELTAGRNSAA